MAMHGNWNPWHGVIRCSEGFQNGCVYCLDRIRSRDQSFGGELWEIVSGESDVRKDMTKS